MIITRDEQIPPLLAETRVIAVVGASDKPTRPSHGVMKTLQDHGYRVIPVNPRLAGGTIHGEYVYAALSEIPEPFDMVDIFRRSEDIPPIVEEAIKLVADKGIRTIWMQLDIFNDAAAEVADAAGLDVVMDRCPAIELRRHSAAIKSLRR